MFAFIQAKNKSCGIVDIPTKGLLFEVLEFGILSLVKFSNVWMGLHGVLHFHRCHFVNSVSF